MSFDFGELLTRAWRITWNHKILWVFALLSILLAYLFMPLGFAPTISIFMAEEAPVWFENPAYIFGYIGIFLLLFVLSFFVGTLSQAAISVGVFQAEGENEEISFRNTLRASIPYFWRYLGILALFTGGFILVMSAFFGIQMLISMVTLGLGAMCMAPLQVLLYPLMLGAYAWLEQAQAAVIVDDVGVFEAVGRGWRVFRKNLFVVLIVSLILYLGVGMISGFVAFPIMVPFFVLPLVLVEEFEYFRTILLIASLCILVYLPVLAVFQSGALTLMKSGWILTYLRLTRGVGIEDINPESV